MKLKDKPVLILLFLLTIICTFIFLPYFITGRAFILGWDMHTEYAPNFDNLRTMLQNLFRNGTLPFWSWNNFLGNDYYSTKLFYFQDIFDYPFALTSMKYSNVIVIQTYIKFLFAGFSYYLYARYNEHKQETSLIGSLIFTFSAYNLQTMMHPFFSSFFVLLPFYYLGVDRYIKEKKPWLFVFMVFLLFIINYYLFYSVSLFTILYFIWRWDKEYRNLHNMMKNAFCLIGWYFIGLLLSGFACIPEIISIIGNPRIGNSSNVWVYDTVKTYIHYLTGFFTPTSTIVNREHNYYYTVTANNSVMAVFLYNTSVFSLLFPQLFKKKDMKKMDFLAFVVISIVALVPLLSSAMHGFSEPSYRWLASPSFLFLTMILPLLDNLEQIDMKLLKNTSLVISLLMLVCPWILKTISQLSLSRVGFDILILYMFVPLLLLTCNYMIKNDGRWKVVLLAELCLVSYWSFFGNPQFSKLDKELMDRSTNILGEKGDFTKAMYGIDPANAVQFYRVYADPDSVYWGLSTNTNYYYDYMGTMTYDTTYNYSAEDMKRLDPRRVEDYLPWTFNVKNPDILNLICTKYAIVDDESEVIFTNYEYEDSYAGLNVYRNLDYVNLGKTYANVITYDDYNPDNSAVLSNTLVCNVEDYDEIKQYLGHEVKSFDTVAVNGNYLFADIQTTEPGFALLAVSYHKGWHVTVNGQTVKPYMVSGGLIGIPIANGYNSIEMFFTPLGLKEGFLASGAGFFAMFIILLKGRRDKIKK